MKEIKLRLVFQHKKDKDFQFEYLTDLTRYKEVIDLYGEDGYYLIEQYIFTGLKDKMEKKIDKKTTQTKVHAKVIENEAYEQIKLISNSPALKGLIAIMPDVHVGKGSVIGFTGHFNGAVIPNIIGVDIGCGVHAYPIGKNDIDFVKLDEYIRLNIPLGFSRREIGRNEPFYKEVEESKLVLDINNVAEKVSSYSGVWNQIGTLGGGNHFIEIGESEDKERYLLIHSGSRNIGKQIAEYYQKKAVEFCKSNNIGTPRDLEYLPFEHGGDDYMKDMRLAQKFASMNRSVMLKIILRHLNIDFKEENLIESIHNFIGDDDIIRKGAISAYEGEKVIVPFNMSEGSIIGIGKSNEEYNFSAPHGAGRVFGRNVMKRKLRDGELTMEDFRESMDGIFSTSVKEVTIDESKFAYKSYDDVKEHLKETVNIVTRLKPIYNLKSD